MYVLWHGVTLIPWPPQEPTPVRFPVWLGIPKPMIPYPLLGEGAVRTIGSHLGRIPNCSEVPDPPPPPPGNPGNRPPWRPSQNPPPPPSPPPPPPPPSRGLRPAVSWGGSWRPGPRGRPPRGGAVLLRRNGMAGERHAAAATEPRPGKHNRPTAQAAPQKGGGRHAGGARVGPAGLDRNGLSREHGDV